MDLRKDPPPIAEAETPGTWVSILAIDGEDTPVIFAENHASWAEAWGRARKELLESSDRALPEDIIQRLNSVESLGRLQNIFLEIDGECYLSKVAAFTLHFVPREV